MYLVHKRAELITHIQILNSQYNLPPFAKKLSFAANRAELDIPALVLLYEIHDSNRFECVGQFLSYARLVRCDHESAGKKLGSGGKKIGNAHLRWAFAEAVCLFLRGSERARQWKQKQEKKHGPG